MARLGNLAPTPSMAVLAFMGVENDCELEGDKPPGDGEVPFARDVRETNEEEDGVRGRAAELVDARPVVAMLARGGAP
eukprot:CAMPEP_0198689764 /NCGR_PEP_ID=MMETSP1468-20131203/151105_1 /TAXON_ID=1461545 /ORGANISM="Mantoniella sp, Strain CCMP1436" /LENGTH=77 /DNA_ID=CAMNT_0044441187 /DNA_START=94 /DNA_END=324 /DNA_ORIENTATION=-